MEYAIMQLNNNALISFYKLKLNSIYAYKTSEKKLHFI